MSDPTQDSTIPGINLKAGSAAKFAFLFAFGILLPLVAVVFTFDHPIDELLVLPTRSLATLLVAPGPRLYGVQSFLPFVQFGAYATTLLTGRLNKRTMVATAIVLGLHLALIVTYLVAHGGLPAVPLETWDD